MPKYSKAWIGNTAHDHEIAGPNGKKLGTLRVKPTGIGWKPANGRQFHSVSLDKLTAWITDEEASGSRLTKK